VVSGSSEQIRGQGARASCPLSPMREPNSRSRLFFEDPKGSSLRIFVPLFRVRPATARQILPPDSIVTGSRNLVSFLLPALRFGCGTVYAVAAFLFAANQSFDSSRWMQSAINGGSKLCACATRHASGNFLSEISAAQLGKGQGFAPPRCIPSHVPCGAAETVPVSAPSGLIRVVAPPSWAVRP